MNKKLLIIFLFFGLNLDVESKIDLKKIANQVKSKMQKAHAMAAVIAIGTIGTIGTVGVVASIISNKTKPEELTYFHDKLLNTIAETNVEEKVNEFKTLSKAQREFKLGDVLLFEVNETQSQEDLKKNLVKITCKNEQDKDKKDLYLSLKTKMVVQLKDNKTVPMNFAKDSEPKKTYLVKTLSELADPITPSNSTHWSRNKNRYFVAGGVLGVAAVGCLGYYYGIHLPDAVETAEKARVEAADEMEKHLKQACIVHGEDSISCLKAHEKLANLCPSVSTNSSCKNAHENLKRIKNLLDRAANNKREYLQMVCMVNGETSNICFKAHQALVNHCPAGSTNPSCKNAHIKLAIIKRLRWSIGLR